MTSQQHANELLSFWQAQRLAGIPANDRRLPPLPDEEAFERDLDVLRRLLERA